jgi:hypothetical protein
MPDGNHYIGHKGCAKDGHKSRVRPHGCGTVYRGNGSVLYCGKFALGKKHGLGMSWNEQAQVVLCGRWLEDDFISIEPVLHTELRDFKILLPNVVAGECCCCCCCCADFILSTYELKELSTNGLNYICTQCCTGAASLQSGQSLLIWPGGGWYVGCSAGNIPEGDGTLFNLDGTERCSGEWKAGQLWEGRSADGAFSGLVWQCDGSTVHCEWKGSMAQGHLVHGTGSSYEGDMKLIALPASSNPNVELFRPHGHGMQWSKGNELEKCGRWAGGRFISQSAVPGSSIKNGLNLRGKRGCSFHPQLSQSTYQATLHSMLVAFSRRRSLLFQWRLLPRRRARRS